MKRCINRDILVRNFSKYAYLYDRHANIQRMVANALIDEVPCVAFANILEIGCGTGYYTNILKSRFKTARLKALDISCEMIKIAKQKLRDEHIEFMVRNAEAIEFYEKFDLITSNAALQWFGDLETALAKYKNLLTHDGVLAFSIFGPLTFKELSESLKDVLGGLADRRNTFIESSNFLVKEDLMRILASHFTKVTIKELAIKERYASLTELLNKIKYTGTRGSGLNRSFLWAPGLLKRIDKLYKARFGGIETSYQIFLCKALR